MTDPLRKLIEDAEARATRLRQEYEEALEDAPLPGARVWVLHDGRRGWMHGQSGIVVTTMDQWVQISFPEGIKQFRLERVSRKPDGMDCWSGRLRAGWCAAQLGDTTRR